MTQELIDLRTSILEGRYQDALNIVDELDWMSKKGTLRTIKSYLIRLLIHLIKNQVEQRLTNSWAASIRGSVVEILDYNLKDNKTSYYVNLNEWETMIEEIFDLAVGEASTEVMEGEYTPFELLEMIDKSQIFTTTQTFLALTYNYSLKDLPAAVDRNLTQLPGGEEWTTGRSKKK